MRPDHGLPFAMMKTLRLLAVLTAALLCGLPASASARTPGSVDPSFGIVSSCGSDFFFPAQSVTNWRSMLKAPCGATPS